MDSHNTSLISEDTITPPQDDYDYLSKIIVIGPSGVGKSCILHRFVKGDWNILTSQTIGVEFSSKIIPVGRYRMKLQLWDTAGQERFRSLTRSYYRGSAGVVLVYDVTNKDSFKQLHEFMADIKSLTNDTISVIVVGNKSDLTQQNNGSTGDLLFDLNSVMKMSGNGDTTKDSIDPTSVVLDEDVLQFCSYYSKELGYEIPFIKSSALMSENIDYIFEKISSTILSKIELGIIDPEETSCGVQYGDLSKWDAQSASSDLKFKNLKILRKKPTTLSLINRRADRINSGWRCC